MSQSELLLVGLNAIVCMVGLGVCVCRQEKMRLSKTKLSIRLQYSMWSGCFVASMISWTYGEPANFTQILMSSAILGYLLIGFNAWRFGAPEYTMRGYDHYWTAGD